SARFLRGIELIMNPDARAGTTESLAKALRRVIRTLPDASRISDKEKTENAREALVAQILGTSSIYISSSASSLAYIGSKAVLSAYVVRSGSLDKEWNETEMRSRVVEGLMKISAWEELPASITSELENMAKAAQAWLASTPYGESLDAAALTALGEEWKKAILGAKSKIESTQLPRARGRIVGALQWNVKAPFHFSRTDASTVDMEKTALELLEKGLTSPVLGKPRPVSERMLYAQALAGFPEDIGGPVRARTRVKIDEEIAAATDAAKRAELRQLRIFLK
ncbi:MAG: hypothetical protein HUU37_08915, partial [Bdellovibrionales bacterium]|nr:hypothetical protein [Bdellovibrionales bacterium]